MKITHCKLKKSVQKKLLEFFVLEVTARSAADILQINPNSAALFYKKIRQVIEYHLLQEADEIFSGLIELDESYLWWHSQRKKRSRSSREGGGFWHLKTTRKSLYRCC